MSHSKVHDEGDPGSPTNEDIGYLRISPDQLIDERFTPHGNRPNKEQPENYFKPYLTEKAKKGGLGRRDRGDDLDRGIDYELCELYLYNNQNEESDNYIGKIKVAVSKEIIDENPEDFKVIRYENVNPGHP